MLQFLRCHVWIQSRDLTTLTLSVCLSLTKEKHLFPALLVFLFPKPPHKMGHVLIIVDNETWDYSPSPSLLSCRLLVGSCYHHGTDWNMTVNCFMQIWNQMFGLPVCKWFLCLGIQKLQARCLLLVQKESHLTQQTRHFLRFFLSWFYTGNLKHTKRFTREKSWHALTPANILWMSADWITPCGDGRVGIPHVMPAFRDSSGGVIIFLRCD